MKRLAFIGLCACVLAAFINLTCKKKEPPVPAAAPPVQPAPQAAVEPEPAEKILKVGAIVPLTGAIATYGDHTLKGIQLAIEDANRKGPVQLKLYYEDNNSDATKSRSAAQKLIEVEKVAVIIGSVASTNTFAAAPVAQAAHVPMVSPASTNVDLTKKGEYISRICYSDDFQAAILAKFAAEELGAKRAAIIVDAKSDYSKGLADAFKGAFEQLGGSIVSKVSFVAGDVDFGAQLTQIRGRNPQVVFVPAYYNDTALILRQAKDKGLRATFIGPDGWDSPKLYEVGGDAVAGNYFTTHFSPDDKSEVVRKFVADYKAKFNEVPDALAALGYDAALAVYDAATRAGDLSPESLKEAINTIKDLEGVTGTITLDENRNPKKDIVILETGTSGATLKTKIAP